MAVVAALLVVMALVVGYAKVAVFSSDGFADRATSALASEEVSSQVATVITTDVVVRHNPDLLGIRPVIQASIEGLINTSVFQDLFRAAVDDVHSAFFLGDQNSLVLTLYDIGEVLRGTVEALAPESSVGIEASEDLPVVEIDPPDWFADLVQLGHDLDEVFWLLIFLAVVFFALAQWRGASRRRTVFVFGISLIVIAVSVMVALTFLRANLISGITDPGAYAAAGATFDAFADDLQRLLLVTAFSGAIFAAAAASLLRPLDARAYAIATWRMIARVPDRGWLRVLRGLAFMVFGIVLLFNRSTAVDAAVWLAGIVIVYIGTAELMRVAVRGQTEAERHADMALGRRALITAGVASATLILIGSVFAATGGVVPERSLRIDTVGCNGSEAYCEMRLDELAIPSTHNSMSAGDDPEWLFAQQDRGIPGQLADGIHGFLIDAHYGQMTESGRVLTDFGVDEGDGSKFAETLGEDAFQSALRLRDRVIRSPTTEAPRVYLCHGFCELGAVTLDESFTNISDFLDVNPDEVLLIVVEDYVQPKAIVQSAVNSGLVDHIYKGTLDGGMPTLQQMIDEGGRVVLMAENHPGTGDSSWYRPAYEALVQETPYSFRSPDALIGENSLEASCEPNRGPGSAPLFLINHWVDTSPSPMPSNALRVNAREPLENRVLTCEEQRGLSANLVAVDFYRQGDVFEVVRDLNAGR